MNQILSETTRVLETLAYPGSNGGLLSTRLPLDTVIRGISSRLSGSVVVTWSSAGAAKETSSFADLVTQMTVDVDGNFNVKTVYPHLLHMHMLLAQKIQGERKCSTAAAAAYNNNPLTDAGFTIPTSTEIATIAETVYLPFEMVLARVGRDDTWLDTRDLSSCDMRFTCAAITNLDKTTNLAFSSISFSFENITIEAKDFPRAKEPKLWKQSYKNITLSSAVTEQWNDLPRGNDVAGISLFVQQNSSGSSATAAYRYKPNNNSLGAIKVRRNGREILSTSFQSLQAQNRARYGINAPFASSASRLDGFARIDFLTEGVLKTALDVRRESGVSSFEIGITSNAENTTGGVNVYPINVHVETSEIVRR